MFQVTWFALIKFISMTSLITCQGIGNGPLSNGNECCGLHLMDTAASRVAIETTRTLTPGTYNAIRLRMCTTDSVHVQLWRYVSNISYALHWETVFTPSATQATLVYVRIPISPSITINSSDRIGLFSTGYQLLVPFSGSPSSTVQLSALVVDEPFTIGQTIQLDTYQWSRTFTNYLAFCVKTDCSDQPAPTTSLGTDPRDTVSYTSTTTTTLATTSCDPSTNSDVSSSLNAQTATIASLQQTLNALIAKISSYVSNNYVTGLCPQGFLSGSYGVGSCYLMFQLPVSLAYAIQNCRSYGAYLLTIETGLEQRFLANFVKNNVAISGKNGVTKFWTSGLFDSSTSSWVWYAGSTNQVGTTGPDATILYTDWLNNTAPIPTSSYDTCLIMNVDTSSSNSTVYWTNGYCTLANFYICEIPKQCL